MNTPEHFKRVPLVNGTVGVVIDFEEGMVGMALANVGSPAKGSARG